MPISILMSKIIFMKYLLTVRPKLVTKFKILRIYWNLAELTFEICQSQFWCQILFSVKTHPLFGPNCSKNQKCSKLIEIWHIQYANPNMPIAILTSKMIFIKYLPPGRPKLVPKLKMLKIYSDLAHLIFQIYQFQC